MQRLTDWEGASSVVEYHATPPSIISDTIVGANDCNSCNNKLHNTVKNHNW